MTIKEAERQAQQMWSKGFEIGQVRWRRKRTPHYWVGICFADGRKPITMGESNVDWESAFAQALGA